MERIDLVMVRDNLTAIPRYDLPAGLSYRMFQKRDDAIWAEIETSADEFASGDLAGRHFRKEFGKLQQELYNRCVFVDTEEGISIGTATAWDQQTFGKPGVAIAVNLSRTSVPCHADDQLQSS